MESWSYRRPLAFVPVMRHCQRYRDGYNLAYAQFKPTDPTRQTVFSRRVGRRELHRTTVCRNLAQSEQSADRSFTNSCDYMINVYLFVERHFIWQSQTTPCVVFVQLFGVKQFVHSTSMQCGSRVRIPRGTGGCQSSLIFCTALLSLSKLLLSRARRAVLTNGHTGHVPRAPGIFFLFEGSPTGCGEINLKKNNYLIVDATAWSYKH